MIASLFVMGTTAVAQSDPVPGKNGNKYVPYEERTGNESIVYFTRNLTAEGLIEAYEQVMSGYLLHPEYLQGRMSSRSLSMSADVVRWYNGRPRNRYWFPRCWHQTNLSGTGL